MKPPSMVPPEEIARRKAARALLEAIAAAKRQQRCRPAYRHRQALDACERWHKPDDVGGIDARAIWRLLSTKF